MSDKQFFTSYAQLIALQPNAPPETFYSTEDYHKLKSLGPSLPQVPSGFPKASASSAQGETSKITFKSIKPPYKFNSTLEIPLDLTVFNIKSQLAESVQILKDAGISASDLKLMLKAKVLTDSTQISSVAKPNEELAITVMVSAPTSTPKAATQSPDTPAAEDPAEAAAEPVVTEATWAKIGLLLALDIGPERAQKAVAQFKTLV